MDLCVCVYFFFLLQTKIIVVGFYFYHYILFYKHFFFSIIWICKCCIFFIFIYTANYKYKTKQNQNKKIKKKLKTKNKKLLISRNSTFFFNKNFLWEIYRHTWRARTYDINDRENDNIKQNIVWKQSQFFYTHCYCTVPSFVMWNKL